MSLSSESNFLPTCCWTSTSHIIFNNPNSSLSGFLNSVGQLAWTTKNLHLTTLSLCFNQPEQTHNCSMLELLHAFRITKLFIVAYNDSTVAFGNKLLNILNGMRLLSALELILYVILVCLYLVLHSNLGKTTDLMILRFIYFTFTTSKLQSYSAAFPG